MTTQQDVAKVITYARGRTGGGAKVPVLYKDGRTNTIEAEVEDVAISDGFDFTTMRFRGKDVQYSDVTGLKVEVVINGVATRTAVIVAGDKNRAIIEASNQLYSVKLNDAVVKVVLREA